MRPCLCSNRLQWAAGYVRCVAPRPFKASGVYLRRVRVLFINWAMAVAEMKAFPEFIVQEEPDYSDTRARACLYTLSPGMAGPFMRERDYLTTQHAYCGAQQLVRLAWE